jgi:uncharacterized protein (TIGR03437 family)
VGFPADGSEGGRARYSAEFKSLLSVTFDQTAVDLSAPYTYSSRAPRYLGPQHINPTVPNVSDGDQRLTVTVNGVL